jgi:hypothetical protein
VPDQPLVVPMQLDALVANQSVLGSNSFRTWPFNYQSLGDFRSPEPIAGDRQTGTVTAGVYLHWTLPEALRHGTRDPKTGDSTYPLVPNRWLVIRLNGTGTRQATGWVIESDCPPATHPTSGPAQSSTYLVGPEILNLWKSSTDPNRNTYVPVVSNGVPVSQIGARFGLAIWQERAANTMFLTAVAPSNALFSIYTAHNAGVFSIYDDLAGIDNDTLSYFLFGWYSDPTQDILSSWVVDQSSKTPYDDLLARLEWTVVGGSETQAVTSVYQGAACNIAWSRTGAVPTPDPLKAIRDSGKLNVAVGNTTIDAFTALIAHQIGDPSKAELLRAFQYDFLQQLNQPNGEALLEEKIRQEWFGSAAGGYNWTIVENNSDGTTAVNLTTAEAAWLLTLNQNQALLDEAVATLYSLQWQLHSLWLKNSYVGCSDNTFPNPPSGVGDVTAFQAQANGQLDPTQPTSLAGQLVAQFGKVQSYLGILPQPVWTGTTNSQTAFQNGITAYAKQMNLDSAKTLKAKAAPRYWQANNPVVLLSGVQPAASAVSNQLLPVRLGSHLVTGLVVDTVTIDAATVGSVMPSYPNLQAIPSPAVLPLLQEFFFLDQANIANIIEITKGNAADITAAMQNYDPTVYQGPLPAITLGNWQQPWNPMFIEWIAKYTDVPFTQAASASWTFDGTDYRYTPSAQAPPATPRNIGGISLLSPHASFVFGSRLQDFITKFGSNTELAQIDQWVDTTYHWQFLAQELTGFNDTLALRDTRAFRRPVATDLAGTLPVAALTGYGDGPIPPALALPDAFQGKVNTIPLIPNGPVVPFTSARHGQIYFTDVYLYDKFGRMLFAVQSNGQSGLFDYTNFPVLIDSAMAPDTKIAVNVASVMQLPPRLLQNARLDMQLLDAIDDTKLFGRDADVMPISGWVLPNHLDSSILIYAPDGTALGEFSLFAGIDGTRTGQWTPPPHRSITLSDVRAAAPHLADMIASGKFATEPAFNAFLASIDTTLWSTDPLGSRVDQNLSVLVGRPLALLRVRMQFQLEGTPITDTGFAATFSPPPSDFVNAPFSIRLGDQATREDGVIGYFTGSNYETFNSVAAPDTTDPQTYVAPIGPLGNTAPANYLQLSFAPNTYSYVTVLADPRAAVHATTGILPVKQLDIPQQFVDAALSQMEISFRMGPLMTQIVPSPNEGSTTPAYPNSLVYPMPVEQNGVWSWWETDATGAWTGYDLVKASSDAQFSNSPNTLREGQFQFVTNLGK